MHQLARGVTSPAEIQQHHPRWIAMMQGPWAACAPIANLAGNSVVIAADILEWIGFTGASRCRRGEPLRRCRETPASVMALSLFVVCKVCCYKRVRESERYEKNKKGFPFAFSCSSSSHHTTTTSTTTIQLKVS